MKQIISLIMLMCFATSAHSIDVEVFVSGAAFHGVGCASLDGWSSSCPTVTIDGDYWGGASHGASATPCPDMFIFAEDTKQLYVFQHCGFISSHPLLKIVSNWPDNLFKGSFE